MLVLILIVALVAPSILANRGTGTRGRWIALALASTILGLLFALTGGSMTNNADQKDSAWLALDVSYFFLTLILGCVFAACFFKPKVQTSAPTTGNQ